MKLAMRGAAPAHLVAAFPALSAPNQWTLTTGLNPAVHGIVSNNFMDPDTNKTFDYYDTAKMEDPMWWRKGEPIWQTASRQGLKPAVINWPGASLCKGYSSR